MPNQMNRVVSQEIGRRKPVSLALPLAMMLCTAWLGAPLQAQSIATDRGVAEALGHVEVWLDSYRAYEDLPGISAAVVLDQELIWSKGFGYADLESKRAATPQTIYSVCSISKLFTSIGMMQLRDKGDLQLNDPVEEHLSWFKIKRTYEESQSPPITIQMLLTHSSGLPRESAHPYWTGPEFIFPTREEMIAGLVEQETLYPAATETQYSNLGFSLAGEIVAAVSGRSYDSYVREEILQPLGMASTSPEIPEGQRDAHLATAYGRRMPGGFRETIPFYLVRGIAPAAGFASTVEDLGRFASWQFRLLETGTTEVIAANTLREMHRVHWMNPNLTTGARGLGFALSRAEDKTFVGHGGSCPGYRTDLSMQPEDRIATVIMVNASDANPGEIADRLYEFVGPAIINAVAVRNGKKVAEQATPSTLDVGPYVGTYRRHSFGSDTGVIAWKGSLALVSLPSGSLTEIKHVSGHTFRVVRDDGELGEVVTFQLGTDGNAVRLTRGVNYSDRLN